MAIHLTGENDSPAGKSHGTFCPSNFFTRIGGMACIASGGFGIICILYWVFLTYHPTPWFDEWDTLQIFSDAHYGNRSWLEVFWSQHNEHRLVLPRMVFYVDLYIFGGSSKFTTTAMLIAHVCLIAVIVLQSQRLHLSQPAHWILGAIAFSLLLSGQPMSNHLWAFQVQWPLVYGLSALCLFCGDGFLRARDANKGARAQFIWLALGWLSGAAATLSMANGMLVLMLLIFQVTILARPFSFVATASTVIVAISMIAAYLAGYVRPSNELGLELAEFEGFLRTGSFLIAYLGSPFAFIGNAAAYLAGAIVLISGILIGISALFGRRFMTTSQATLGLIVLMIIGTGILTSIGRASQGFEGATESRYVAPNLLAISSLIILLLSVFARRCSDQGLRRRMVQYPLIIVSFAVATYTVVSHFFLPYDYAPLPQLKEKAAVAILSGARDTAAIGAVTATPDRAIGLQRFMLELGAGPYSGASQNYMGAWLWQVASVEVKECAGNLDGIMVRFLDPPGGASVSGWAWDTSKGGPAEKILIVDSKLRIVGMGVSGEYRADVSAAVKEVHGDTSGWIGTIGPSEGQLRAFIYLGKGRVCALAGAVEL